MLHALNRSHRVAALLAAGGAALALGMAGVVAQGHVVAAGSATPIGLLCQVVGPPLPVVAAALAPAALAVMAPCLLQLTTVLVAATAGLAVSAGRALLRPGLTFAAGFLGVYAVAALVLGLAGQALAAWSFALQAVGGALIAALGLAVLRVLPRRALPGCRGPRWLILTGRASLRRPFGAGAAFAVYCAGCCGPYLAGVAALGASTSSALAGAALVFGFALAMGVLLLLPLLAVGASRRLQVTLAAHAPVVALVAGAILIAAGAALALEPLLVLALAR